MMNETKGTCILLVTMFVSSCPMEIQGQELFFKHFLKTFNYENPVFIQTNDMDQDLSKIDDDSIAILRYTTSKDEEQVAYHIQSLYNLSDITVVVFMDEGHTKLLDLLFNSMELFKRGLDGLISETDAKTGLNLTLRLDTRLYTYSSRVDSIHLNEMYNVNGKKKVEIVGIWKLNTGLIVPTKSLWERRSNLEGMSIRVTTINLQHLHEIHYDQSGESVIGGGGFCIELLDIMAKELNFTWKLQTSNDGHWGAMENGRWNGMIGMLINQQTDIAVAILTMTKERRKVVTFSRTIMNDELTLITAVEEQNANPWIYIDIFPHSAWYLSFAMVIGIAICFAMIHHSGLNYMHNQYDSENFTIMNGVGVSLTLLRQIYYDVNIISNSARILFFLSALSTFLLYEHYTAFLIASSTHGITDQIDSFRAVLDGGYQVYVMKNSAQHDLLRYAEPGSSTHELYHKTMKDKPNVFLQSREDREEILLTKGTFIYGSSVFYRAQYKNILYYNIQGISDSN